MKNEPLVPRGLVNSTAKETGIESSLKVKLAKNGYGTVTCKYQ